MSYPRDVIGEVEGWKREGEVTVNEDMPEHADGPKVRIESWADTDEYLELLRRKNAPEMTEHLGGPETDEKVVARHKRYVEIAGTGTGRMFRIVLLPGRETVGSLGYWEKVWHGETVYETGWGVLPPYQGRGIAAAAVAASIARAAAERKHQYMHAYPSIGNTASNALCRKLGFTFVAECDFEYPRGSIMRCNDWRLDLTAR
jgi:RimJ/RimL family protein N-acetyltransferase